jgi:glyoxylase-like metal-dependent hydrolase (beta-lactamase superfamily II)
MTVLAQGIRFIDLDFQGIAHVIATAVIDGPDGVALVDPGPASTLATLRRKLGDLGVSIGDVTALLLTHIHLDHAGASGSLVRENSRIRVHVHERGAPHMVDPRRLLESASRLYGDQMHALWGEFEAVPAAAVRALSGAETLAVAGRAFEVAYTPGHASHHVSYFDSRSRTAFVGDTAGVRIGSTAYIQPPTPPPDIDLDAWSASADRILAWQPETLFLTHFGPGQAPPAHHLQELLERLRTSARLAGTALESGGTDEEQARRYQQDARLELRRHMTEAEAVSYELAVPLDHCYLGLARYWRKRAAAAAKTPAPPRTGASGA